jgi:hypothetical protein
MALPSADANKEPAKLPTIVKKLDPVVDTPEVPGKISGQFLTLPGPIK